MKRKLKKATPNQHRHRRVFILIGLTMISTLSLSSLAYDRLNEQSDLRFIADTRRVTSFMVKDIESYNSVLYSARSYAINTTELTQAGWDNFLRSQQTFKNNPGISSVFLVSAIKHENLPSYAAFLRDNNLISSDFIVRPAGDRAVYGFSTYFSSQDDLSKFRDFDIFSTNDRKLVYDIASKENKITASKPFLLATGVNGFFITLPIIANDHSVKQYVAASFHTSDFVSSLFRGAQINIATRVLDVTDPKHELPLFTTTNWVGSSTDLTRSDTVRFSNRIWRLEYRSDRSYDSDMLTRRLALLILILGSIIIALLLVAHVRHLKSE